MSRILTDWDFTQKHVNEANLVTRGFASAESIVLVAGPSLGNGLNPNNLTTIGVVESAAISQNKQIQQIFEIGSRLPYNIPGRTSVNASLSRIMFDGASLMATLHTSAGGVPSEYTQNDSPGYNIDGTIGGNEESPEFFLNLASTYFNNPIGLGLIFHDNHDEPLAMIYLEECLIRSHTMSIGAGQTIVMENCNIAATNIQPINYGSKILS